MQIHFITYGDDKYKNAKIRIKQEAENMELFSSIDIYEPNDMSDEFKTKYADILEHKIGGGYWLWKPYFVLKKLNEIDENDFLIYCDAGCTININGKERLLEYLELVKKSDNGIISFQMVMPERTYTTKEILDYMNANSEIRNSGQYVGGILIMKKCENTMKIFNEFFKVIDHDHMLITNYYNKIDQISEFIDNRHDQSILSILRKKYGSVIIPDETFWGDFNCPQALKVPFLATRKP